MFSQGLVVKTILFFQESFKTSDNIAFFSKKTAPKIFQKMSINCNVAIFTFFFFFKTEWSHQGLVTFKCFLLKGITLEWKKSLFPIKVKARIVESNLVKNVQHRFLCIFTFLYCLSMNRKWNVLKYKSITCLFCEKTVVQLFK